MDDQTAHFMTVAGELCGAARLGGLTVAATTDAGRTVEGVPDGPEHTTGANELDHTGLENELRVGDETVSLSSIVELTLRRP